MGRAPCCDKTNVKKGPWSSEEDAKLKDYIQNYGTGGNWIALPPKIGLKRCGKSCRLRWLNYLRPNIKHGGFSEEEDNIICNLYISIGSRWSIIAAQLPGRTDNDIKNYWNTKLKKKLLGRRKQANRLSLDPNGIETLSNSAIERLQLHMQLQSLHENPHYDDIINPNISWPCKLNPIIQEKMMQSSLQLVNESSASNHLISNPLQQDQYYSSMINGMENSINISKPSSSLVVLESDGGIIKEPQTPSMELQQFQAEIDEVLMSNKGPLHMTSTDQFDCFKEMEMEMYGGLSWWSNELMETNTA